jgi:hypothetical protein
MATIDGLVRFDGVRFLHWHRFRNERVRNLTSREGLISDDVDVKRGHAPSGSTRG